MARWGRQTRSDAATSQGHRGHQQLEEAEGPSPGASGGVQPGHLDLGTPGLQDGERMSAVLSYQLVVL